MARRRFLQTGRFAAWAGAAALLLAGLAPAVAPILAPVFAEEPAPFEGGWKPPQELLDAASRLGDRDDARRAMALEALTAMSPAERVRLLRAGLRSQDEAVARACAARLKWTEVDEAESARIADLAIPEVLKPGTEFDFDEVRSLIGTSETGRLLESLETPPWSAGVKGALSNLHRSVYVEHLPSLARLASSPNAEVAQAAAEDLGISLEYTDRHREEVLPYLLGRPWDPEDDMPPEGDAAAREPGLSLSLRRALLASWLVGKSSTDSIHPAAGYVLRWLRDETPGKRDLPLLGQLVDHGPYRVQSAALRAIARIPGDEASHALEARTKADDEDVALAALGGLARRGDARALADLAAKGAAASDLDSLAFALWAEAAPGAAGEHFRSRLLASDEAARETAFDFLSSFHNHGGSVEEVPIPTALFDGAAAAAEIAPLDGLTLARIAAETPGARTHGLAAAALAAWNAHPPTVDLHDLLRDHDDALAFLEAAEPEAFRALFRTWLAKDAPAKARALAVDLLLKMRDAPSADLLLAAVLDGVFGVMGGEEAWVLLAAAGSASPAVVEVIRSRAAKDRKAGALAALSATQGIPVDVATALAANQGFGAFADLVLEGKPVEAILAWLAANEGDTSVPVGLVRDPRVLADLNALRERRETGLYLWATEQAMLGGDPVAREELARAYRAGRYRWIDERDPRILTLNRDLATIPGWFDHLETNCCRGGTVATIFRGSWHALFDLPDAYAFSRSTPWTPAAVYRRWWAEVSPRLTWSLITERFVEGPR